MNFCYPIPIFWGEKRNERSMIPPTLLPLFLLFLGKLDERESGKATEPTTYLFFQFIESGRVSQERSALEP